MYGLLPLVLIRGRSGENPIPLASMDDLLNCRIVSQSPSNASFCPLLDISNELLYKILFYSLDFQREPLVDKWKTISPFIRHSYHAPKFALVLRSVCRHIRNLVNDMSFWYLPTFDPITFLPETRQTVADQQLFLNLLLADKHLQLTWDGKHVGPFLRFRIYMRCSNTSLIFDKMLS